MVNILARILDSERNFNGSADPMITADRGFIQFWGADFGFWLLGSSSLLFLFVSARFCFDTDVGYINISGAPNDNFLSVPLKRYFRRSGVALNLYRFILGSAIIFLSVRSF